MIGRRRQQELAQRYGRDGGGDRWGRGPQGASAGTSARRLPFTFYERLFLLAAVEGRLSVAVLRWIGVMVVLWYERGVFYRDSLECTLLPTATSRLRTLFEKARKSVEARRKAAVSHVAGSLGVRAALPDERSDASELITMQLTLLADPQLVDRHSYDGLNHLPLGLGRLAYGVVRWAADTYVRKSFDAVVRSSGGSKSEAVVWLGDMLDGGRRSWEGADSIVNTKDSYLQNVERFRNLCRERLPSVYISGNHDVRIPLTHNAELETETRESQQRYLQTWGTWFDTKSLQSTWSVGERASGSRKSTARKVVLRPPLSNDRAANEALFREVLSDDWKRTVNARLPLHLDPTKATPTHEILLIDALELAGMMPVGTGDQNVPSSDGTSTDVKQAKWWQDATLRFPETTSFIDKLGKEASVASNLKSGSDPVRVLFSHIPLWRTPHSPCSFNASLKDEISLSSIGILDAGWERETSQSLDQGMDRYATYQNEIGQPVTDWLLRNTRPNLIFSGDSHDHCHTQHHLGRPGFSSDGLVEAGPHELTLKAFSMTGGVRKPGFARLLLTYDPLTQRSGALAMPCLLPDQVEIWTKAYPSALALILGFLFVGRILSGIITRRRKRIFSDVARISFRSPQINHKNPANGPFTYPRECCQVVVLPFFVWICLQLF